MMITQPPAATMKMKSPELTDYKQLDRATRLHCVHPNDFHNRPTVFDEIVTDTEHLIQNVIRPYIDPGCVNLTEEELKGECRHKIARLLHDNKDTLISNRYEFFKYLKTALNNHVKGQVQRNRFTLKRTGIRPPEKGDFLAEHHKPIEISIDDPESRIQVPEDNDFDTYSELLDDWSSVLTPLEVLVMNQAVTPNAMAVLYSKMDMWGDFVRSGRNSNLKVSNVHLAIGLGMGIEQFLLIRKQLQAKLKAIMSSQIDDYSWNASVAFLSKIYAVEVPRSTDKTVVRRLFSLASRSMLPKLSDEVRHHLSVVGARIPVDQGNLALSCFGIMYEDQNAKCMGCGIKSACVVETRSLGLDKITPHPSILGRSVRTPAVNVDLPEFGTQANPRAMPAIPMDEGVNERSIEIVNFLNTNFQRAEQAKKDDSQEKIISYALKHGSKSPILWLGKSSEDGELSLRFTRPSKDLKNKLVQVANGFYLDKNSSVKEAMKLIEALANEKTQTDEN